jgi:hypothetical protein
LDVQPCIVKFYRAPLILHLCRSAIPCCFTTCKFGAKWSNVDLQILVWEIIWTCITFLWLELSTNISLLNRSTLIPCKNLYWKGLYFRKYLTIKHYSNIHMKRCIKRYSKLKIMSIWYMNHHNHF